MDLPSGRGLRSRKPSGSPASDQPLFTSVKALTSAEGTKNGYIFLAAAVVPFVLVIILALGVGYFFAGFQGFTWSVPGVMAYGSGFAVEAVCLACFFAAAKVLYLELDARKRRGADHAGRAGWGAHHWVAGRQQWRWLGMTESELPYTLMIIVFLLSICYSPYSKGVLPAPDARALACILLKEAEYGTPSGPSPSSQSFRIS